MVRKNHISGSRATFWPDLRFKIQGLNAPKSAISSEGVCYCPNQLNLDLRAKPSFWIYDTSMQTKILMGLTRSFSLFLARVYQETFMWNLFIYSHFNINFNKQVVLN